MRKKRIPDTFVILLVTVFFSMCGISAHAKTPPPTPPGSIGHLVYEDGMLSLHTTSVPLITLLGEIAATTNIKIVTTSKIYTDQLIDVDIESQPLEQVLYSLLNGYNYLVCFCSDASLKGLYLYAGIASSPEGGQGKVFSDIGRHVTIEEGAANFLGKRTTKREYSNNNTSISKIASEGTSSSLEETSSSKKSLQSTAQEDGIVSPENVQGGFDNEPFEPVEENSGVLEQAALEKSWKREDFLLGQIKMLSARIESGESDRHYDYWSKRKNPKYVTHDRERLEKYERELDKLLESS